MIFAGKILKDGESLQQHGIKDGVVVHLVVRSPPATTNTTTNPTDSGNQSSANARSASATTNFNVNLYVNYVHIFT